MREKLRRDAAAFFRTGIQAVEPQTAVLKTLKKFHPRLPSPPGRIFLIAVGKAATAMLRGAQRHLRERGYGDAYCCLLITDHSNFAPLDGCECYGASHPIPDEDGLRASKRVIEVLTETNSNDLVLVLISGGGSALLPCPPAGISLNDEIVLNRLVLTSGVSISESNLIRQQFSILKGGGLARLAAPAKVLTLLLSDVPGDDIRTIAGGLTSSPLGSEAQAMALARERGLWDRFPPTMQDYLLARKKQQAKSPDNAENILVGSNFILVNAMQAAAVAAGYATHFIEGWLEGDVGAVAKRLLDQACGLYSSNQSLALCSGGETTVIVSGTGKGGRNQELALRFALDAKKRCDIHAPWAFLSCGSDGRDGPTDAAGGLVDDNSVARMLAAGVSPQKLLENNDSYHALAASEDLLITGATGTNVADAQIFLSAPNPPN